jgi:adenine nucleotide transporter 17
MTSTLSPLTQAVTGALGSASANALAYPLDVVTTRLQVTKSRKFRGFLPSYRRASPSEFSVQEFAAH